MLAGEDVPLSRVRIFALRAIPLRRLKRKIRRMGPVVAGEKFADDLERDPASRQRWGASAWSEQTYNAMAGFGEALSKSLIDPTTALPDSAVTTVKTALSITPDQEQAVLAMGADMNEQIRIGLPTFAGAPQMLASCSDSDLLDAREMCSAVSEVAEGMKRLHEFMPHPLISLMLNAIPKSGMQNSDGFALSLAALIKARSDGTLDPLGTLRTLRDSVRNSVTTIKTINSQDQGAVAGSTLSPPVDATT